jgi:two-component system, OmpR family, KDP operon response regulator KdpE
MQDKKILVVDDDIETLTLLRALLAKHGARPITAPDGESALRHFYQHRPDLVIVDIMMPLMSGWELCRRIREMSDVPLIMLTALHGHQETVRALNLGCDDYITKPFHPRMLVARAHALLRRARHERVPARGYTADDGHLTIDFERHRVHVGGKPVRLTPTEFSLLALLARNVGRLCTMAQIKRQVWGGEELVSSSTVHVFISQLRKKLESGAHGRRYIHSEYGTGYRFE